MSMHLPHYSDLEGIYSSQYLSVRSQHCIILICCIIRTGYISVPPLNPPIHSLLPVSLGFQECLQKLFFRGLDVKPTLTVVYDDQNIQSQEYMGSWTCDGKLGAYCDGVIIFL